MRLYLFAVSANKRTFWPDYLIVQGNDKTIRFEIQGSFDGGKELNCRIKGENSDISPELIEIDGKISTSIPQYTDDQLYEFIKNGKKYIVGVGALEYDKEELEMEGETIDENDERLKPLEATFSKGKGNLKFDGKPQITFEFDTEVIY